MRVFYSRNLRIFVAVLCNFLLLTLLFMQFKDKQKPFKITTREFSTEKEVQKLTTATKSSKVYKIRRDFPQWVEVFDLPYKPFEHQNIPIVIFSSYRDNYLAQSMESLRNQTNDVSPTTHCIFVLHQTALTESERIAKTMEVIKSVKFCEVSVWKYKTMEKPTSAVYKDLWWSVLERVFNGGSPYKGDVFFLEEDAILSPDAIKVLWFCCRVKNTFGPDIWQVALGGHAGKNMVNPHPDTVNIRKTVYFQAMTYAFNSTLWELIKNHKKSIFHNADNDFSEALAYFFAWPKLHITLNVVAPTMGRMWHIGSKGLGEKEDYSVEREIETKSSWVKAPRFIDLEKAEVNDGIRDQHGFLCEPSQRTRWRTFNDNLCKNMQNLYPASWYNVLCVKQPFVNDNCM